MAKSFIDRALDRIFDEEWKGRYGEKLTERELKLVKFFGRSGKVLRNVYVPKPDGGTSEIDVIFITQKGIFVIESKNYSGWIFGNESDRNWTVSLPGGHKERFYNPIKQNQGHIKWLRKYLVEDIPLFSIVAFSERCELKKVTVDSPDIYVIKRDRLYATVRKIWDSAPDVLDETCVNDLVEKLACLTNADAATKAAHVESIEQRFKDATPKESAKPDKDTLDSSEVTDTAETPDLEDACPRCGSQLVLRTTKKGANAGKQFYGCSSFPKCRYTREV